MEREVDNSVRGAVAGDIDAVAVAVGNIVDIEVGYRNRVVIEELPKGPCRADCYTADLGREGVPEASFHRLELANSDLDGRVPAYSH